MTTAIYVIAEAGVNHNGDHDLAFRLVDIAADSGADAIKFQTFDAERLASESATKADYQLKTTDAQESQLDMLRRLELPRDWHAPLKEHANARGIDFLSTAFDADSLDFLIDLGLPRFKVPSGELTNGPLLWKFARSRVPLILSTGMATLSEVEQALAVVVHALNADGPPAGLDDIWRSWSNGDARRALDGHVALLHCTSQYPAPFDEVNLRAMDTLRDAFGLQIGYSDHSAGLTIPVAAAARGATIIEKHFTADRTMDGPDHRASLEPEELCEMITALRAIERALGDGVKAPQASEWGTRAAGRQQVIAVREIAEGEIFADDNLGTARTGGQGLPPSAIWQLIGTPARQAYDRGSLILS